MNSDEDRALLELLNALKARDYQFITPTPATHKFSGWDERVSNARGVRDVFGWSKRFKPKVLDDELLRLLSRAGMLDACEDGFFCRVRVSSLDELLLVHSRYPTWMQDTVFFGPDSYRFASFLKAELPKQTQRQHLVDIGTGTGVGGILAARLSPDARVTLTDINPDALRFASVNSAHAGVEVETVLTTGLAGIDGSIDCIIANPPYIADPLHRAYRDGGAMHGAALSLDWAKQAAERLQTDGVFLLYTGSAIVEGEDRFKAALVDVLEGFDVSYREIDPDVFGEELEREDYADVERIAVVGVVAVKR